MTNDFVPLTEVERICLLGLARRCLEDSKVSYLSLGENVPPYSRLLDPSGAFVTLKRGHALRGCIGRLDARWPLWETVIRMARQAALADPRFDPVSPEEVPDLTIEISVLSPIEPLASIEDIQIGKDGLIVESVEGRRGVLLPQVASSRGWDVPTFLDQTCLKARLDPGAWRRRDVSLCRFTAQVFSEIGD